MVLSNNDVTAQLKAYFSQSGLSLQGQVLEVAVTKHFEAFADAVLRLRLTYSEGSLAAAPKTLIYKELGPTWYSAVGLPELRFYTELAPITKSPLVPTLYGAANDPKSQTCVLLLEDLSPAYELATLPLSDARLETTVDELALWHAFWWHHPRLLVSDLQTPAPIGDVTRMPHALDATGLEENERLAQGALEAFIRRYSDELTAAEMQLLQKLEGCWGRVFRSRLQSAHQLTLLHGDFHLLGNIFFARAGDAPPKVIDWAQAKPGLGPHDLMYALLSADAPDRLARDTALLKRYYDELSKGGVKGYSWAQCLWDYRFSLLTNLWQSVFQGSLGWFRKTSDVVSIWESEGLLV